MKRLKKGTAGSSARRGEGSAVLTPTVERTILKSFAATGLENRWWKSLTKELRHCRKCGGTLRWAHIHVEGRKRFVCMDCRLITYQNPKLVAATLPEKDGKIFLLRRAIEPSLGLWSHPAGFMELAETVEEAAIRETKEEICCRVKVSGPPSLYSYRDAAVVTVVYPARVVSGTPHAGPESLEVRAFRPQEIPWNGLAFRSTFHALRDWVKRKSG